MKTSPTLSCTPRSGFTILELAVTVIMIAVIAVVALPMYKHAILKSRFSTVMPMAKAVADAQEIYYLGNNQYALGKEDLDIAPVEAENTQVSLSPAEEDEEYIYVAAHRTDIPNVRYIMYQKNSPKFASNIHCEADANDEDALWLCEKALHGTEVTGSLQGKQYKTFLLAGDLGGSSFKVCPENAVCNDEGNVTGCESGYYQEEQTCKQEKTCDESKKTIRTSCAEDCGEEIKEGACNVKTGQWENYTVTQACPTKPPLTKACSAIDSKWTSGTAQGTTQCSGNSWAEPEWDETDCKKACDPEKEPKASQTCDEYYDTTDQWCGMVTQNVACDYTTGEWKVSNVVKNCEGRAYSQGDTQTCDEYNKTSLQYCGTKTAGAPTCEEGAGKWAWNYHWSGTCAAKGDVENTAQYKACGKAYTIPGNYISRSRTCNGGSWSAYTENDDACGCKVSEDPGPKAASCTCGTGVYESQCTGNTWGHKSYNTCQATPYAVGDMYGETGGCAHKLMYQTGSCVNGKWTMSSTISRCFATDEEVCDFVYKENISLGISANVCPGF